MLQLDYYSFCNKGVAFRNRGVELRVCTHRGIIGVVSVRMYMNVYVYTVYLRKKMVRAVKIILLG